MSDVDVPILDRWRRRATCWPIAAEAANIMATGIRPRSGTYRSQPDPPRRCIHIRRKPGCHHLILATAGPFGRKGFVRYAATGLANGVHGRIMGGDPHVPG